MCFLIISLLYIVQKLKSYPNDVGLVFLSSDQSNVIFNSQKSMAKKLINKYKVGVASTLFGIVHNGKEPEIVLHIGNADTKADTTTVLDSLIYHDSKEENDKMMKTLSLTDDMFNKKKSLRKVKSNSLFIFIGKAAVSVLTNEAKQKIQEFEKNDIKPIFVVLGKLSSKDKAILLNIIKDPKRIVNPDSVDDFNGKDVIATTTSGT